MAQATADEKWIVLSNDFDIPFEKEENHTQFRLSPRVEKRIWRF